MQYVEIQVQAFGGLWQTIIQVEASNSIGIAMRLDEAVRTYNQRCRARDPRTGNILDYRQP